jgi:plasmid stabilization system protein ParE
VKYKLIVRPRAEIDVADHFFYLSKRNPGAAVRFEKAVNAATKKITANPKVGARLNLPRVQHLDMQFVRPKGFSSYLIVFRVVGDGVYVSRILHGSQDIESVLLEG